MRFLPIFVDTAGKKIIVIGGGPAAEAKLRTLIKSDADITVIAPSVTTEISRWAAANSKLNIEEREFDESDLAGASLLYAATENAAENSRLAKLAKKRGLFVNAADQKEDCSFYSPAIVDRSPLIVAIGSEGAAPGLARALKADIETRLPKSTGRLTRKIAELRTKLSSIMPMFSDRQRLWAEIFPPNSDLSSRLNYSDAALDQAYEAALSGSASERTGKVSLVGAGPGSLDLLTIGAQRRLHSADVIVYDRLVSQEVLDIARREAKYIYVGKSPGAHTTRQEEINRIIVEEAKAGHKVVRLKGGDPLIFGRADEEIDALEAAGVDYEIVPGITSAAAAAASIGASLTSRGHNKSVALLTGHDTKGFAEQDWASLAQPNARAAVYMGLGASRFIQGRLMLHGASSEYPVTIVENASRENEKIVETTLGNMIEDIEKHDVLGPAILLLGYATRDAAMNGNLPLRAAL